MIKDIILYDYVSQKVEHTGLTANSIEKTITPNNTTTTKIELSNIASWINKIVTFKHAIFVLDEQNNIISGGLILSAPEIDTTNNTATFLLENITGLLKEQPYLGYKITGKNGPIISVFRQFKQALDRYDPNIYTQIISNPIFSKATATFSDGIVEYQQGIDLDLFEILTNLFQSSDIAFSDDWQITGNKITPKISIHSRLTALLDEKVRVEEGINLIEHENITSTDTYANYVLVIGADNTSSTNTTSNSQIPPINIYKTKPNNTRLAHCQIVSDKRLKTTNKCLSRADYVFKKMGTENSISSITIRDHAWAKIHDLAIYQAIPIHLKNQVFISRIDEITINYQSNTAQLKLFTKEQ